jgi:SAM-dependent methyltransferase
VGLLDPLAQRLPPGAWVLEAGCGAGVPVSRRLARSFRVVGVDFAEAQAKEFCSQLASEQQFACPEDLFDIALEMYQLDQAESLCRVVLTEDLGRCLWLLARRLATSDDVRAAALCSEFEPAYARHFGCVLDVALAIKFKDRTRAFGLCQQLPSDEAEACRAEIEK